MKNKNCKKIISVIVLLAVFCLSILFFENIWGICSQKKRRQKTSGDRLFSGLPRHQKSGKRNTLRGGI